MDLKDFTDDTSLAFVVHLKQAGILPDFVGGVPEASDLTNLPDLTFGAPNQRKFPLHTKEAAYLSACSMIVLGAPSGPWHERVKIACDSHGIGEQVKAAAALLDPVREAPAVAHDKVAAAQDTNFALVVQYPDNTIGYHYPINGDAVELEKSARELCADILDQRLPLSYFAEASEALMKAASAAGVADDRIPSNVRAMGERRYADTDCIDEQLDIRKSAASLSDETVAKYRGFADEAIQDHSKMAHAIERWEILDRTNGVTHGGRIQDPVAVFKSGAKVEWSEKLASETFVLGDSTLLPLSVLRGLSDKLSVVALPKEAAVLVMQAKQAKEGTEATRILNGLSDVDRIALGRLILAENA